MGETWLRISLSVWHQLIVIQLLMVVLTPAAIGDYQRQKVPNWLSMPGWIVGPLVAWCCAGGSGLSDSLLGLLFMVGLFFPLWMFHWFGAADVKLMGTVGAFVGISDAPVVLLGVVLAGLVMSLLILLYRKSLFTSLRNFISVLKDIFMSIWMKVRWGRELQLPVEATEQIAIPYAIPIALGTMLTLLYLQL